LIRVSQLRLPLEHTEAELRAAVRARLGLESDAPLELTIFKRSYDVRKKHAPVFVYTVDVVTPNAEAIRSGFTDDPEISATPDTAYRFVHSTDEVSAHIARAGAQRPVVIGMGPCGLFAALILAQMGLRPIVLERGKKVRERTVDTFGFWRSGALDPGSNVQFGEGGAGTFSDGEALQPGP
jgi:uncharacterized FAD-dependent dehydrogenase